MKFNFILFYICISSISPAYSYTIKDSTLVLSLNKEAFNLAYNKTQDAKSKGFMALNISKSINYKFGEAQACSRLGIIYDVEGLYDSALYFHKLSLEINRKSKNKKSEGAALCNIGLIHLNLNQYYEALQFLHAAIKPLEEVNEYMFLGNCYNNIGMLYTELDNYSRAIYNYEQAIYNYDKMNNVYQKAKALSNLSMLLSDLEKYDSSEILALEAIKIFESEEDYYSLAKNYNNLAILYIETNRRELVEEAFLKSADYAKKAGHIAGLADTYINLAMYYIREGNIKLSNEYTKMAYEMTEKIQSPKIKADIFYQYARICAREGKYQLSTKLFIQSKILKDSIFKSEIASKIASQESRFGLERKDNENKQLKQKNRIQELEIINKQNEIRSRQYLIAGLITLSLIALLFTSIYLRRRYTIQRLIDENKHREEKQKQRVHISHELHDNVGAQLSYIVSNLGILEVQDPQNSRIQSLSEMSKQAIVTLRETVWALIHESINLTSFADKFKQYINKHLEFNDTISCTFEENIEVDMVLQPMQALNLFRIGQEAFSNAVKHSGAAKINVELSSDKSGNIVLKITDNGIGFDQDEAKKKGHFGLDSMQVRADEMSAKISITSKQDKGSMVSIAFSNQTSTT